jgi:hypothetical protein
MGKGWLVIRCNKLSAVRQLFLTVLGSALVLAACGGSGTTMQSSAEAYSSDQPLHIVISEINYHDVSDDDSKDFIELFNNHDDEVAVTGWCIRGVGFCFTDVTIMQPGTYLVITGSQFGGRLGNKGERIRLVDAQENIRDEVTYADSDPWPESADGDGDSLHRLDLISAADSHTAWVAGVPTPGQAMPETLLRTGADNKPRFSSVEHLSSPAAFAPVVVMARNGQASSAQLHYRYNFENEVTVEMTKDAEEQWIARIPGAPAGTLVRYRLTSNVRGTDVVWPEAEDGIAYDGTVVATPTASALPKLQWFMDETEFQRLRNNRKLNGDEGFAAVFAYDGEIVDNVVIRIKGQESRGRNKNKYKVTLPQGHTWKMKGLLRSSVDEFGLHSMLTDKSFSREILTYDLQTFAGGLSQQVFPVRLELNNEFYGLYVYHEQPDSRWRKLHGFDDNTVVIKGERISTLRPGHVLRSDEEMNIDYRRQTQKDNFNMDEVRWLINEVNQVDEKVIAFAYKHIDIPQVVNALAVARVSQHVELEHKNWMMFYDPRDEKWRFQAIDHDLNFGKKWTAGCASRCDEVFANPYMNYMEANRFGRIFIRIPEFRSMLDRRTRTLADAFLSEGRIESRLDDLHKVMQVDAELDIKKWGQYGTPQTMREGQDLIVNNYVIPKRGFYFRSDNKYLPISQSRNLSYTISGTKSVKITSTDSIAIDISGIALPTLRGKVPPGTVLNPGQSAVFVDQRVTRPELQPNDLHIFVEPIDSN